MYSKFHAASCLVYDTVSVTALTLRDTIITPFCVNAKQSRKKDLHAIF
jgi:hypothetical protein